MMKLLTIQHPTPGERYAAGIGIVAGAVVAGLLADALLAEQSAIAMAFISIPLGFAAINRGITAPLDRVIVWYSERQEHGTGSKERRQDR